jgi:hypothetical protein
LLKIYTASVSLKHQDLIHYVSVLNPSVLVRQREYMLYTQKSTSLIVKMLTINKCYEIFTPESGGIRFIKTQL